MLYIGEFKDSNLKSITHVDGTCRFQTVDNTNKYFYNLIKEFYKLSGCPLLLNTSFNINGKPIRRCSKSKKYKRVPRISKNIEALSLIIHKAGFGKPDAFEEFCPASDWNQSVS